jgi:hypothetical protein
MIPRKTRVVFFFYSRENTEFLQSFFGQFIVMRAPFNFPVRICVVNTLFFILSSVLFKNDGVILPNISNNKKLRKLRLRLPNVPGSDPRELKDKYGGSCILDILKTL